MIEGGRSAGSFRELLGSQSLSPLWDVLHALVPAQPASVCHPHIWRYDEVRPLVLLAGETISAKEAQRRVLILENPALPGQSRITNTLYAGLQLILPGEVAPAHRHTQSALRFIQEGERAFTSVEGEKLVMTPGDLILTPPWLWHDHGHEGSEPVIWLDGLDIPTVQFYEASFAESLPYDAQNVAKPIGDSIARFGSNMLPVDWAPPVTSSPVVHYRYDVAREALERMRRSDEWDECHGLKMRYTNPATGGHIMPTISAFVQLLPKGFSSAGYRSTDGTVFVCVEGTGRTRIGDKTFDWNAKDVFVAPSWSDIHHHADADAVLFSFSDRSAQEKLGLWREMRIAD